MIELIICCFLGIIYISVAATIFSIANFIIGIYKSALATGHWIIVHLIILFGIVSYYIPFDIFKQIMQP